MTYSILVKLCLETSTPWKRCKSSQLLQWIWTNAWFREHVPVWKTQQSHETTPKILSWAFSWIIKFKLLSDRRAAPPPHPGHHLWMISFIGSVHSNLLKLIIFHIGHIYDGMSGKNSVTKKKKKITNLCIFFLSRKETCLHWEKSGRTSVVFIMPAVEDLAKLFFCRIQQYTL